VGTVIEVLRFQLNEGTSVDDFVAINDTYQTEFAYQQQGLRRRTVAPGLDGEWLVLTIWSTKSDVRHAEREAENSPVARAFEACLDTTTKSVQYYKELPG
jgi:hypothetical protein